MSSVAPTQGGLAAVGGGGAKGDWNQLTLALQSPVSQGTFIPSVDRMPSVRAPMKAKAGM
eukprot:scaffold3272_cov239-Pinguiococcus_pyrenoidosus.AAC.9